MTDRDANHVVVWKGVTDDVAEDVVELLVDPATGRLLIEIIPVDDAGGILPPEDILGRDQNHITVEGAVTDDIAEDVYALVMDNRNGLLYLDVEEE